jgi:hypothetical protein
VMTMRFCPTLPDRYGNLTTLTRMCLVLGGPDSHAPSPAQSLDGLSLPYSSAQAQLESRLCSCVVCMGRLYSNQAISIIMSYTRVLVDH